MVEGRLLCRGWDFCIENKITNFLNFETDLELMRTSGHKKISNLSDKKLAALKSLKFNINIVIYKADKGNCIVILDKEVYIKKAEDILKGEQFELLSNDKFHRQREKELNKYIFSLLKRRSSIE